MAGSYGYRDYDGVTREVEKHGRTKAAAERLLAAGSLAAERIVVTIGMGAGGGGQREEQPQSTGRSLQISVPERSRARSRLRILRGASSAASSEELGVCEP